MSHSYWLEVFKEVVVLFTGSCREDFQEFKTKLRLRSQKVVGMGNNRFERARIRNLWDNYYTLQIVNLVIQKEFISVY